MIKSILSLKSGKVVNETSARMIDLAKRKQLMWVDVSDPSSDELSLLETTFNVKMPDSDHTHSLKTRFDNTQNATFFEVHEISFSKDLVHFHTLQILIGNHFLITLHNGTLDTIEQVREYLRSHPGVFKKNPSAILHKILDVVVDEFLQTTDSMQDIIDSMESQIFSSPSDETIRRIFKLKRSAIKLRKVVVQQRELLNFLSRGDSPYIVSSDEHNYHELYDHMLLVTQVVETIRELITSLLEVHVSLISQKLNEVMKTLTIIATIMMPMTLITGIYGMNFLFIPEIHSIWGMEYGYYLALSMMAGVALVMLAYFRRKRWF